MELGDIEGKSFEGSKFIVPLKTKDELD